MPDEINALKKRVQDLEESFEILVSFLAISLVRLNTISMSNVASRAKDPDDANEIIAEAMDALREPAASGLLQILDEFIAKPSVPRPVFLLYESIRELAVMPDATKIDLVAIVEAARRRYPKSHE